MELMNNLGIGFATALSLTNLSYCFFGVLLGTLIGVAIALVVSRRRGAPKRIRTVAAERV